MWKITSLVTSFMTSSTAFRIFPPSLVHSLNVFLQDVGSGKSVSCIVWENTLPSICILKRLLYSILYIIFPKLQAVGSWGDHSFAQNSWYESEWICKGRPGQRAPLGQMLIYLYFIDFIENLIDISNWNLRTGTLGFTAGKSRIGYVALECT